MIEFIKNWITSISVCIFFIIAIESILPSNNLKKYAKFVLGLILIITIINPIIKVFNKNVNILNSINIDEYTDKKLYKSTYDEYKYKNIENTVETFKTNLEKECINKLKKKYPDNNFKVDVSVKYIEKNNNFDIESVNIGVEKNKLVKKVEINTSSNFKVKEQVDDILSKDIKNYIKDEFKIPINIINIYKI